MNSAKFRAKGRKWDYLEGGFFFERKGPYLVGDKVHECKWFCLDAKCITYSWARASFDIGVPTSSVALDGRRRRLWCQWTAKLSLLELVAQSERCTAHTNDASSRMKKHPIRQEHLDFRGDWRFLRGGTQPSLLLLDWLPELEWPSKAQRPRK